MPARRQWRVPPAPRLLRSREAPLPAPRIAFAQALAGPGCCPRRSRSALNPVPSSLPAARHAPPLAPPIGSSESLSSPGRQALPKIRNPNSAERAWARRHHDCQTLDSGHPGGPPPFPDSGPKRLDLGCVKMAKCTKKVGIVGKYTTRYGASLRKTVKKTEISQQAKNTCSFCGKTKMKRRAVGIWHCGSCMKTLLVVPRPTHHCCCHRKVCHQKTEGIEGPVEAPPFDNIASL
ncbi:hypothetical protein MJT46_001622 [Ovis ammon polii x Ovis aries]|nr:hypothetical protein MJT46_001622 [Ovis ammon polii x Ovis aries]